MNLGNVILLDPKAFKFYLNYKKQVLDSNKMTIHPESVLIFYSGIIREVEEAQNLKKSLR